jgi:predicted NACHT family NTPase
MLKAMSSSERSLKATPASCTLLTEALKQSRYTKSSIGDFIQYQKSDGQIAAGVSRATVAKFFKGDPVARGIFIGLCDLLELNWQEVAELETNNADEVDIEWVRSQVEADLRRRCGTMRVLDMEQPITLGTIYTQVNVLEKLTANQRLSSSELLKNLDEVEEFDRFCLGTVRQKKISGLDAVTRHKALMLLGRPGAGKTTFLKYLTITCLDGEFLGDLVPIFVALKEWTEFPGAPSLLSFISRQWSDCGIGDAESVLNQCLKNGQALVLLDGLDEVLAIHTDRTIREMRDWLDRFPKNHILTTCRIAAKEYTFERFTEVEAADFSEEQITKFVANWFTHHQDSTKIERFLNHLKNEKLILELASNPLLLTLLCLVFGESGAFPSNRAKLYEEGVDLLLKKWDGKRNIQRDQVYKNLSINRKEDLLSQLALATFQEGSYFFDQGVAEEQIMAYIHNLPDAKDDPEALRLDSEAILRSIVAQHGLLTERARGVYSFSHLTFHEYFAAREIIANQNWEIVFSHLNDSSWREVTLLVANGVRNGNELITFLKKSVDSILSEDEQLQAFINWSAAKADSVSTRHKKSAIVAFYYSLDLSLDTELGLARTLDSNHSLDLAFSRAFALDITLDSSLELDLATDVALYRAFRHNLNQNIEQAYNYASKMGNLALCDQLSNLKNEQVTERWKNAFQSLMIEHRNIGHDWKFSKHQKELLKRYHDANLRLAECLDTDCYLSREVRQDIEATMLRPIAQIKEYYAAKGKPYPPVPNP